MAQWPWSKAAEAADAIAKRYGITAGEMSEPGVEALRAEVQTLNAQGPAWAAASARYGRVLPAHLEAVHGHQRDREFRDLADGSIRGNAFALMCAEEMHHEAHGWYEVVE